MSQSPKAGIHYICNCSLGKDLNVHNFHVQKFLTHGYMDIM